MIFPLQQVSSVYIAFRVRALVFLWAVFGVFLQAQSAETDALVARAPQPVAKLEPGVVLEAGLSSFEQTDYADAVFRLFDRYESMTGELLAPGETGRVGLKVYTNSGSGIATSPELLRAVIAALEERGFERSNLFILDMDEQFLRQAGIFPLLSERRSDFEGVPVYALQSGAYYDEVWFYDSPLPPRQYERGVLADLRKDLQVSDEDRKSFLATPLLLGLDFWINLPVAVHHRGVGVSGAMANPSIWACSNNERFHDNPANAPLVAAEIAAIPELQAGWVFSILSLEKYQYIGGHGFRSLYTESEPRLWMSSDPVALDALMLRRMNAARRSKSLPEMTDPLPLLEYGRALGMGVHRAEAIRIEPVE